MDTYGGCLVTVAVLSLVRMQPRSTAQLRTQLTTSLKKHSGSWTGQRKQKLQLAYAIGVAQPVSVCIDTFGTGTVAESKIAGSGSSVLICVQRYHSNAGSETPNLSSDSLWPHG